MTRHAEMPPTRRRPIAGMAQTEPAPKPPGTSAPAPPRPDRTPRRPTTTHDGAQQGPTTLPTRPWPAGPPRTTAPPAW